MSAKSKLAYSTNCKDEAGSLAFLILHGFLADTLAVHLQFEDHRVLLIGHLLTCNPRYDIHTKDNAGITADFPLIPLLFH